MSLSALSMMLRNDCSCEINFFWWWLLHWETVRLGIYWAICLKIWFFFLSWELSKEGLNSCKKRRYIISYLRLHRPVPPTTFSWDSDFIYQLLWRKAQFLSVVKPPGSPGSPGVSETDVIRYLGRSKSNSPSILLYITYVRDLVLLRISYSKS